MNYPKDKKELQRFLGMVTYISKFIEIFSHKTAPLRELLKKNVNFIFDKNQQIVFDNLKENSQDTVSKNFRSK